MPHLDTQNQHENHGENQGVGTPPLINPYLELPRDPAARKQLIWAYSWAIPSTEAIRAIARLSPIVELGAGTGYWGWLLRQAGADVVCLDRNPEAPPHWTTVEHGTPESLSTHPELAGRTLLLVWPPLADGPNCMALEALRHWQGTHLVYVGEWRGRTASPEFHDALEQHFELEQESLLPRWPGFEDSLRIYCRK